MNEIIAFLGAVFMIAWFIVPFVLVAKLNQMIKLLKSMNDQVALQTHIASKASREPSEIV